MSNTNPTPEFLAQDTGAKLTATAIAFIVILLIFAGLRLASQRIKGRPFDLTDLFSYVGLIFILGSCIIAIIMVPLAGVGRHVAYLEQAAPHKLAREYIIMYPIEITYILSFTFPKLSILFMYLKIFRTRTTRYATFALIGMVVGTGIAELLTAIFQCWPIEFIWDKSVKGGHCVKQDAMFQFWSIPNIVSDTAMLILPLPTVWKLQMSRVQKIGLTFTFMLGSIGLIASIVRFVIFTRTLALVDATWASVELQIWTFVEPSMYFFAGILPGLRPLITPFVSKIKTVVGSTKSLGSSAASKGSRGRGDDSLPIGSGNKSWKPLHGEARPTKDGYQNSDDLALVEYRQNIVGGVSKNPSIEENNLEPGITRTQEVRVTREAV